MCALFNNSFPYNNILLKELERLILIGLKYLPLIDVIKNLFFPTFERVNPCIKPCPAGVRSVCGFIGDTASNSLLKKGYSIVKKRCSVGSALTAACAACRFAT